MYKTLKDKEKLKIQIQTKLDKRQS
jgi:hypothetical protein